MPASNATRRKRTAQALPRERQKAVQMEMRPNDITMIGIHLEEGERVVNLLGEGERRNHLPGPIHLHTRFDGIWRDRLMVRSRFRVERDDALRKRYRRRLGKQRVSSGVNRSSAKLRTEHGKEPARRRDLSVDSHSNESVKLTCRSSIRLAPGPPQDLRALHCRWKEERG